MKVKYQNIVVEGESDKQTLLRQAIKGHLGVRYAGDPLAGVPPMEPPAAEIETLLTEYDRQADAEQRSVSAREWYEANPNAGLLFSLSISELIARIDEINLATAAGQNQLKLLLKTLAVAVRVLARREGLL